MNGSRAASPRAGRPASLALVALLACVAGLAQTPSPEAYDLFYRSDSGTVLLWVHSATGRFRWWDSGRSVDFSGQGTVAFPNLGPMVLSYSGEAPGYDWVILALKVYGTRATGSLTLFPTGEPARKTVSLFYDRDTRNDVPPAPRRPKRRASPPPAVGDLQTGPKPEVPAPPPPSRPPS